MWHCTARDYFKFSFNLKSHFARIICAQALVATFTRNKSDSEKCFRIVTFTSKFIKIKKEFYLMILFHLFGTI